MLIFFQLVKLFLIIIVMTDFLCGLIDFLEAVLQGRIFLYNLIIPIRKLAKMFTANDNAASLTAVSSQVSDHLIFLLAQPAFLLQQP